MELSVSDAIRLLMMHIAEVHHRPFAIKAPNTDTLDAISELEAGKGKQLNTVDDLIAELNENN